MRNAFADELVQLADADPRIVLLSGDIGNRLFDTFRARFPARFYNCGVAEANMIGVAAGMALCGLRPYVYTIASFATGRCLEQLRVDVCYHSLPVVIVGVGAGLSYASLGATHHACEDIAWLRVIPEMSVVCPADSFEVRGALRASLAGNGPLYLRLGKKGEPPVHQWAPDFRIGRSLSLREGRDVALLGIGTAVPIACQVGDLLDEQGISARIESFHSIKPLDNRTLAEVFAECKLVATIEEHSQLGGAGGAVAEWVARQSTTPKAHLVCFGSPDAFIREAGSQAYARDRCGLTPTAIAAALMSMFRDERRNTAAVTEGTGL